MVVVVVVAVVVPSRVIIVGSILVARVQTNQANAIIIVQKFDGGKV